jgi:hypothetical protein
MLGFSANDTSLVSVAADGTIRRWSIGERVGSVQVRVDASAQSACYDPLAAHAVVTSAAGTLLLAVADPE